MTANNPHPYRDNHPIPVCVVAGCDALAHLLCPDCGRPFCIDHTGTASSCTDCQFKAPSRRSILPVVAGSVLGAGGIATFLFALGSAWFMPIDPALGGMVAVLGTLSGALVAAIGGTRRGRGWQPVEGNALTVRLDGDEDRPHRRVGLSSRRNRTGAAFQNSVGRFQL